MPLLPTAAAFSFFTSSRWMLPPAVRSMSRSFHIFCVFAVAANNPQTLAQEKIKITKCHAAYNGFFSDISLKFEKDEDSRGDDGKRASSLHYCSFLFSLTVALPKL
jgi:hypothetical protein